MVAGAMRTCATSFHRRGCGHMAMPLPFWSQSRARRFWIQFSEPGVQWTSASCSHIDGECPKWVDRMWSLLLAKVVGQLWMPNHIGQILLLWVLQLQALRAAVAGQSLMRPSQSRRRRLWLFLCGGVEAGRLAYRVPLLHVDVLRRAARHTSSNCKPRRRVM